MASQRNRHPPGTAFPERERGDEGGIAHPGQELTDPATGAQLRFVRTARSSRGEAVTMELEVSRGWSAGPLHVHPAQSEEVRISRGVFQARAGRQERLLRPGDKITVPPQTAHTIRLLSEKGALEAEFIPALHTDDLFETMYSANSGRRPPGFVPAGLRAWVESLGFTQEIRYLWPRRAGAAAAVFVVLISLAHRLRRSG